MQQQPQQHAQRMAYPHLQRAYGSLDAAYGAPVHSYSPVSASSSPSVQTAHGFHYSHQSHHGVQSGHLNDYAPLNHTPQPSAPPRMAVSVHEQLQQPRQHQQTMVPNGTTNSGYNAYAHQQPQYMQQMTLQNHQMEQTPVYRQAHEAQQPSPTAYWNQSSRYPLTPPPQNPLSPLDTYLLARALQTATLHQESHQIMLFAQSNRRNPNVFLQAYQNNKRAFDELVNQLRGEQSAASVEHHLEQPYSAPSSHPGAVQSSPSLHGTPSHTSGSVPPTVVSLPGAMSSNHITMQPQGVAATHYGMNPSMPTSAPASVGSFSFHRSLSFSTDMDLPSDTSSPMLETPTSASVPTTANVALNPYKPGSSGGYKSPDVPPTLQNAAPPPSPTKKGANGSREGEPYNDEEIRLIEEVIREAVSQNPEIKMAQLGQLINERDSTRPATAWSRQLSKRKGAIEKARELARQGKSLANFPIDAAGRKGGVNASAGGGAVTIRPPTEGDEEDGESISLGIRNRAIGEDDDDDYEDRPPKRRKGL